MVIRIKDKYISLLRTEEGIIYPWVSVIASLLLVIALFTVQQYKNHVKLTLVHQSYIIRQNLLESAQASFHEEVSTNPSLLLEQPVQYSFSNPNGEAVATCIDEETDTLECLWKITEHGGGTKDIKTYVKVH